MSDNPPLKSAFELAMERLREQDREAGVEEAAPLSNKQKQEIERLRSEAKAKIAEREIMHRQHVTAAQGDPAKLLELEEHLHVDRRRTDSWLESEIERVKRGSR